jgi:hypothetical protein
MRSGVFTVRSAYRLVKQLEFNESGGVACSSNSSGVRPIWRTIWGLSIPPKVQIFVWRAVMQGLATRENKFKRRLEPQSTC